MKKLLLLATLAGTTRWAAAHDGHGLLGMHWHAADAWGLVALGVVFAGALWARRGG